MVFGTAERFAAALRELANEQATGTKEAIAALPVLPDLRVALNVAAADLRPLVVVHATDAKRLGALLEPLREAAWSERFVGRFRYVVLDEAKDLDGFRSLALRPGISVVQAEAYGRGGELLRHVVAPKDAAALGELLAAGLERFDAEAKRVREHQRRAAREGIEWEPAIEVTDPGRGR